MILALDLDDTLLRSDKSVTPRNVEALRRWLACGHEVVVATGRPPRWVAGVLPPELLPAPRIVYNGAQVIDDGRVLYRNEVTPDDVRAVVAWAQQHRPAWTLGLEIDNVLYLNRPAGKADAVIVEDLQTLCDRPAAKIIFPFAERCTELDILLAAMPRGVRTLVTPKFHLVQMCAAGADKADALAHLLAQRGLSFDDVVAIGDDINDVGMVRCARVGVAVANAIDEVLAVADVVTAANDEDGVAQALDLILAQQLAPSV